MQLSSRILTALAVLILAVAVVAVRAGSPGTVEAATGTINVINVGTCYTTDTDVFNAADCNDGDADDQKGYPGEGDPSGYEVAGRDAATKADSVFATYSIDPKTSGDEPRAILVNADLIKINIEDKGRDKRTGVLYAVGTPVDRSDGQRWNPAPDAAETAGGLIDRVLGDKLAKDIVDENGMVTLTEPATATFDGPDAGITRSSLYQYVLTGVGSTLHPMAPKDDGKVSWFGTVAVSSADAVFGDLTGEYVNIDEDQYTGSVDRGIAPWMRVSVEVPANTTIVVEYIYYQTSEEEELIGGAKDGELPRC